MKIFKNENREHLITFCSQNEIIMAFSLSINISFTIPKKSINNYMLSNRNIHHSQIQDIRCLNAANIKQDHNSVLAKMVMQLK